MGDVYWGLHLPLAVGIRRSGIVRCVETGTYFGVGAAQLSAIFPEVWTIEREARLFELCERLYGGVLRNVRFMNASGPDGLSSLLANDFGPALFVLDAHWFPTDALDAASGVHCEVLAELTALREGGVGPDGSFVFIDDADMFLRSLPSDFHDRDFPSIFELFDVLRSELGFEYVSVCDDVIIAGPESLRAIEAEYLESRGLIRGPGGKRVKASDFVI